MKKVPSFKSEKTEREFWAKHDSSAHIDWSRGRRVSLPELRPSLRRVSLRLPESMLKDLKVLANRIDVPYQSADQALPGRAHPARTGSQHCGNIEQRPTAIGCPSAPGVAAERQAGQAPRGRP